MNILEIEILRHIYYSGSRRATFWLWLLMHVSLFPVDLLNRRMDVLAPCYSAYRKNYVTIFWHLENIGL